MGIGDNVMATGMARGAAANGQRIAFGDGKKIIWDQHSAQIFAGNPNIARIGQEKFPGTKWIHFCKGRRIYNVQDMANYRWIWNYDFKATPGEIFLTEKEKAVAGAHGRDFVVIEPSVQSWKVAAPNKEWGREKYQAVADDLLRQGIRIVQFGYHKTQPLRNVPIIQTPTFRAAIAVLQNAMLYVGPEGGLHHAAAAVDTKAVVLFGGFIPPQVTGYESHINLTGGAEACGSLRPCAHCLAAMAAISIDEVLASIYGSIQ